MADVPDDLMTKLVTLAEEGEAGALQAFLVAHPGHAAELSARLEALQRLGVLRRKGSAEDGRSVQRRLGDFTLLEQLGSGAMGVVYRARQESLGRIVALKVMRPELALMPGARQRFLREVEAISRMSHPGVVAIHTASEDEGVLFFAMELVEGIGLDQVLVEWRGRDPKSIDATTLNRLVGSDAHRGTWGHVCLRLVRQVADALAHAHACGIVHRDVKPSNLLLTRDGRVVLIDFGLVVMEGSHRLTKTGGFLGTPAYVAPEVLGGEVNAPRPDQDVFALAVVLAQLACLRHPYAEDAEQVSPARMPKLVGKTLRLRQGLSADGEAVCLAAMDPDPKRRYRDAAELRDDIDRVLAFEPVLARLPGPVLRARRWIKRHPTTGVTLALGIPLLVVAPLLAFDRARRESDLARAQIEAVGEFVLAAAPKNAQGRRLTLGEHLDARIEQWKAEWADRPEYLGSLLLFAGRAYLDLGRTRDARRSLSAALELLSCSPRLMRESIEQCHLYLGRALAGGAAASKEAQRHLDSLVAMRLDRLGPSDPLVAEAYAALSLLNGNSSTFRGLEAERALRRAWDMLVSFPEAKDIARQVTIELATILMQPGNERLNEAAALVEPLIDRDNAWRSTADGVRLQSLWWALACQRGVLAGERAEQSGREILAAASALYLDAGHPEAAAIRQMLASWLLREGRTEAALAVVDEVRGRIEQVLSPDSSVLLSFLTLRAHALQSLGQFAPAHHEFEAALTVATRIDGGELGHAQMDVEQDNALCFFAEGDLPAAESLLRHEIEVFTTGQIKTRESHHLGQRLVNLGRVLAAQGRIEAAEVALQRGLEQQFETVGGDAVGTLHALEANLALLRAHREPEAAARLLDEAIQRFRLRLDAIAATPLDLDRPGHAAQIEISVARVSWIVGHYMIERDRLDEARPYLQRARRLLSQHFGSAHPQSRATELDLRRLDAAAFPDGEASLALFSGRR